jgi:catechol 2,3-dioxygenase
MSSTPQPVAAGVRIGHVHLKVADLSRALGFYCGVLGFQLTQRYGTQAAFISAGGYHHHLGLNTWESLGGRPSSTPRGPTWPTPCAGSTPRASRSTAPATMA